MSVEQLKNELTVKMAELSEKIDSFDKMRIALKLQVALKTVDRYMSGEIRKLELAELIIAQAEKLIASKKTA